jgi:hypothetical protein
MLWEGSKMVSSVRAGMIAQEKEKKRQTRLAEQGITTPPEVVVKAIIEQNPLEVLEVIENVEPKAKQSTEKDKPKKKAKAKKQSKNNNKVLKDS